MPNHFVVNAGYDALDRWIRFGIARSRAPQIQLDPATHVIVRDELGLALGGIRLSQHEAPTALNAGFNGGPVFCRLFGTHQPFDAETLDQLYQPADALRTIDEAIRSDVGR